MGASVGKKRKKTLNEINITPLVDVMLVLLIIFMVTAPMMEQGLEVDLPKTKSSGIENSEKPFVLVLKDNKKIYIGGESVKMDQLAEKLKAIFKTRKNKQIYLKADKDVPYGLVARVLGEVRGAQLFQVSLVTLPQ